MQTLNAYSLFDVKTGLYSQPHFLQTNGHAIRSFALACENADSDLNKFHSDFSLFHIGTFNTETGELTKQLPKQLATATEFINHVPKLTYDTLMAEIDSLKKQLKINKTIDSALNS